MIDSFTIKRVCELVNERVDQRGHESRVDQKSHESQIGQVGHDKHTGQRGYDEQVGRGSHGEQSCQAVNTLFRGMNWVILSRHMRYVQQREHT